MHISRMRLHQVLPIFCILVMCTWASHFFDQEWNIWKSKYGKTYVTVDEELLRRKTWEDTWYKVQKHNELADQGLTSYRMAMNHFADMVSVIESRLCIKNHEFMDLSEQQLVDCDTQDSGCCGGLQILALMYVADQGVMKTEDYAYTGKKMACSYNSDEAILLNTTKYYLLSGEENLASSVALEGPITTGFGVSSDFLLYSEGIYDGDCSKNPNHAIIIVGYGTEQEEENNAYWIIKNSWGEEWGEIGYGKIERNINKCYIA